MSCLGTARPRCWCACAATSDPGYGRSWREDLTAAAAQRAGLSRRGTRWALEALVIDHLTASRIAAGLGVSWHTANDAVLAEGKRVLIDDPGRFDGVKVIGVDEHVWRHTRGSGRFVTVIIDLTPYTFHQWWAAPAHTAGVPDSWARALHPGSLPPARLPPPRPFFLPRLPGPARTPRQPPPAQFPPPAPSPPAPPSR